MQNRVKIIRLESVDSTNSWLAKHAPTEDADITVVTAEYQTDGRGQGQNRWESEKGENLLFSILVHPVMVPLNRQFQLSMTEALALKEVLSDYVEGITLKWPNDVYWHDKKLSGTLIENMLGGGHVKNCIFGTGINVNQPRFSSDAPNPVSLRQILGHEVGRDDLLEKIVAAFEKYYALLCQGDYADISAMYMDALYRKHGFWKYRDADGVFDAALVEVEDDGHLVLRDKEGVVRSYAFKQVEYVI